MAARATLTLQRGAEVGQEIEIRIEFEKPGEGLAGYGLGIRGIQG